MEMIGGTSYISLVYMLYHNIQIEPLLGAIAPPPVPPPTCMPKITNEVLYY